MGDGCISYFLEIWTGAAGEEDKIVEIKEFYSCEECRQYVLEKKLAHYCVYKGECIIDEPGTSNLHEGE